MWFSPLTHSTYVQGLFIVVTSWTFVVQIEYLIDGMDLDEDWCLQYLDGQAQAQVRSKSTQIAKKRENGLTPRI